MEEASPASSSSSSTTSPPSTTTNTNTSAGANPVTPPPTILTRLPNPPTLIEYGGMRFLIMDAPTDSNLPLYLQEMQRNGVTDCVRVCEPTYAKGRMQAAGIRLHDWSFPDGESPPEPIISDWLCLVETHLAGVNSNGGSAIQEKAIACHCVAGLGRAPVLVAIALIEFGSMSALDAITFIRSRRRGVINNKQLKFLEAYHPRKRPARRCVIQ